MALTNKYSILCMAALFAITLYGCGEKTITATSSTKLEESQGCIDCHSSYQSPVTGKFVAEEWKLSAHNLKNGAGCADCHDFDPSHESARGCNSCHQALIHAYRTKNPDSAGKCAKCHTSGAGFSMSIYNDITNNTLTNHFSTPTLAAYTSGKYKARYVTKNYDKSCRSCHNPHDTTSQMDKLRQWARSGKGNVAAPPWTYYDFGRDPRLSTATPGATPANSFGSDCVRCHTATGHINYLANKSIASPFGITSKTEGKEVLACNVCHIDYSYARRKVEAVTAYYNISGTTGGMKIRISKKYADIGESNLCLNCHVGREIGKVISGLAGSVPEIIPDINYLVTPTATYDFKNASFVNSHYLTAGATVFRTSGFEFYNSSYYDNPPFYAHDKIGVSDFRNTGTSGPCITCHMKPGNHTFLPVVKDTNGNVTALSNGATCNNALCHNGGMSGTEIERQKLQFNAAMDSLKAMLQERLSVYFYNANPYMFTKPYVVNYVETGSCLNQAVKNWLSKDPATAPAPAPAPVYDPLTKKCSTTITGGIDGTGANNMGAAFNYNLLYHDYGAFAHNRFYVKRLIYDSISWLYDNNIYVKTNVDGYFSDVEAAIQNSASLTAQQKSDACNYLFTSRAYPTYAAKDPRNWRPGSDPSSPVY